MKDRAGLCQGVSPFSFPSVIWVYSHIMRLTRLVGFLLLLGLVALPGWALAQGVAPTANPVLSLAVAPGAPDKVLAGVLNSPQPAAVYRSQDGGVSWSNTTPGLAPNISVAALTFGARNGRIALAADGGSGFLFRSTDGGVTWAEIPGFKELLSPNSAVGALYSTVEEGETVYYAGTRFDGVLRSADDGESWQQLADGLVGEARRIRELITYRDALYVGTHNGLYRLPAGATVWESVAGFPDDGIVYALAVQGDTLFAGTSNLLYQSSDGDQWLRVPNAPNTVYYDLLDSGRLLVLATETGLYVGAGDAWQLANVDGAPYSLSVDSLANTARAPAPSTRELSPIGCSAVTTKAAILPPSLSCRRWMCGQRWRRRRQLPRHRRRPRQHRRQPPRQLRQQPPLRRQPPPPARLRPIHRSRLQPHCRLPRHCRPLRRLLLQRRLTTPTGTPTPLAPEAASAAADSHWYNRHQRNDPAARTDRSGGQRLRSHPRSDCGGQQTAGWRQGRGAEHGCWFVACPDT